RHHAAVQRTARRARVDVVAQTARARIGTAVVGRVLFAVQPEAKQVVAQCPFEIGACRLARIQRGFELGTAGAAAIPRQRGGHAVAGGTIVEDPVAVLVHQRALHAVALVLAVHQLHGQVVVHLPAVGTRPVAATHGVHDLVGTFTHGAATLVVIGVDVGER